MKTKILNALRTEYANLGLGDKAFDGVASFLVQTVSEEGQIADAIKQEGVKNLLKSIQGESDSLRNRASQLQKDLDDYKKNHPDPEPKQDPKGGEEEPAYVKKLREQLEGITARMDGQERARKAQETISNVTASLKNAGCTQEEILRLSMVGFSLRDNETEEQAVERIKADYDASVKKIYGAGGAPAPQGGGAGSGDDDAAIVRRKAWVDQHRVDTGQETKTN